MIIMIGEEYRREWEYRSVVLKGRKGTTKKEEGKNKKNEEEGARKGVITRKNRGINKR